ncbi:hypothetical protein [Deinococcus pimensis]|uniref:hypothetical protein n=1 Tax=Deinococcus pimensis TaxID=309888 RepID=UPI00047FEBF0|nr:hypothetical protein [Deinococcus pimensis]
MTVDPEVRAFLARVAPDYLESVERGDIAVSPEHTPFTEDDHEETEEPPAAKAPRGWRDRLTLALGARPDFSLAWSESVEYLAPVRTQLGRTYRLVVLLVTLARLARNEQERAVTVELSHWEAAAVLGVSTSTIEALLAAGSPTAKLVSRFASWSDARRDCRAGSRLPPVVTVGKAYTVYLHDRASDALNGRRVKLSEPPRVLARNFFRDVREGVTEAFARTQGMLPRAKRGTNKVMRGDHVPSGAAWWVVQRLVDRVTGLDAEQVELDPGVTCFELDAQLASPPAGDAALLRAWVQDTTSMLTALLSPRDHLDWCAVVWTALRDGRLARLRDAAHHVLVRKRDASVRNRSALLHYFLSN